MSQIKINNRVSIPLSEVSFRFSRSSGAGGQNVNKVNTKVSLLWIPSSSAALSPLALERLLSKTGSRTNSKGVLQITSQRYRDQGRNVADCIEKLQKLVAAALVVPKKRVKTKPSKAARQKRLDDKRRQSDKKLLRKPPA